MADTPISWDWNFGDGHTASGQAVNHTYLTAGTFTVTLTVSDDSGRTTTTSFGYIVATAAVIADTPVSWDWDFGDGHIGSGQTVNHTYSALGKHAISLIITDLKGRSATTSFGYVESTTTYTLDRIFSWDFGDGNADNGQTVSHTYLIAGLWHVQLNVTDSRGGSDVRSYVVDVWDNRVFYDWDFGDGITLTTIDVPSATHLYTYGGDFNATLTLYDTWQRVFYALGLTVSVDAVADFTAVPLTGFQPLLVSFTDTTTGSATTWSWDFGDGSTSILQNPTHLYSTSGIYTVVLSINGGASVKVKNNYIGVVPILANFSATPLSGAADLAVQFTDLSTWAGSWLWDFGDGTAFSTIQNPTHTYTAPGTYTVTLSINGGVSSETKTDYIVLYALYTEDQSIPESRQDLRLMPIRGHGNYLFPKNGIRVMISRSSSLSTGSGFSRPQGPSIVFD